mgnify:CR=1 FL=1
MKEKVKSSKLYFNLIGEYLTKYDDDDDEADEDWLTN